MKQDFSDAIIDQYRSVPNLFNTLIYLFITFWHVHACIYVSVHACVYPPPPPPPPPVLKLASLALTPLPHIEKLPAPMRGIIIEQNKSNICFSNNTAV